MRKVTSGGAPAQGETVSLRCPHCRREGTFVRNQNVTDLGWAEPARLPTGQEVLRSGFWAGARVCPNPECRGLVLIQCGPIGGRKVYPPETIDFDAASLPTRIISSLEEAIICHAAGAYRATTLMVRRVLEELCEDRGAKGRDLKARLSDLGQNVVVPQELLDAADELRLLGNDAAHIEAKSYDDIGQDEAALAVELAKELLKAVYQYQNLVDRLRGLRKA